MVIALLLAVLQGAAPSDLETRVHVGFSPDAVPERGADGTAEALAWDLAQLVPERVSGRAVPAEEISAAVMRVLEDLDRIAPEFRTLVFARLRGQLDRTSAERVGELLLAGGAEYRSDLLALLQASAVEDVVDVLLAVVLDESQPAPERGVLAEHLLLARGRETLERIRPAVRADAAPQFLRRVLAGWRGMVQPEDLPWLETLARDGEFYPAQFALQLWAMHETDPARRLEIFRLARAADASYRQIALDALGRQGHHPGIADGLRRWMDEGDATLRAQARRMLPTFAGPEALWLEYRERAAGAIPTVQAGWMATLAASPLTEARAEAARWLAEHGRTSGATAMAVGRLLAADEEIDSYLPALLRQSELPERVRWPLALSRAATSEAARDVLRERIELDDGLVQQQAIMRLGAVGLEQDLVLLEQVARGRDYAPGSRAAALRTLAGAGRADGLLAEWLESPPRGYEVAAAFVHAVFSSGTPQQVMRLRATLADGLGLGDADERRGMRITAWAAAGSRGGEDMVSYLSAELAAQLEAVPRVEDGWPSLYDLAHELYELDACLDALLRCSASVSAERLDAALVAIPVHDAAPHAVFHAAGRIARFAPRAGGDWFDALDVAGLGDADRLRVAGLRAWSLDPHPSALVGYRELLADAPRLHAYPRDLAEVFSPQGAGWTLFADRIEERARVLRARAVDGDARLALLRALLVGRVDGGALADGAALAAATDGGMELALALAGRRTANEPLSGSAHAQLAALNERAGEPESAVTSWRTALRTLAPGSPLRAEGAAALERLGG